MAQIIAVITKDAESKTSSNDKNYVRFNAVEVVDSYVNKQGERVEVKSFYNCIMWNREKLAPYLTKGKSVQLRGHIKTEPYNDKQGEPQASILLTVRELDFLPGGSKKKEADANNTHEPKPKKQTEAAGVAENPDDLPF